MSSLGKLVWITGRSGAGKTTLGENFKKLDDWVHFDSDIWVNGGDPLEDSGQIPTKEMLEKKDPVVGSIYTEMVMKGFMALFNDEDPDISVWKSYHVCLCSAIIQVREKVKPKNVRTEFVTQHTKPSHTKHVRFGHFFSF